MTLWYRGSSLIRNCILIGPYIRLILEGGAFSDERRQYRRTTMQRWRWSRRSVDVRCV